MNLQELSERYFDHFVQGHSNNLIDRSTDAATAAEFAKFVFHITHDEPFASITDEQVLFCGKQQITLRHPLQIEGLNA